MLPTILTLWRTLSGKARRKHCSRRRPGYRPLLEVLEDRAVPASLSYSTFLNGAVYASAVDSAGNIYVTGSSSSLPTTPGAFETSGSGAFVAKLNPTGTAVLYATYLGNGVASGGAAGTGIAVDSAGDAFVIGRNINVPTTPNALATLGRVFVAELNPTGSALVYSTYLPGAVTYPLTFGYSGAIAVDGSGNIDVVGSAEAGFPVTAGAFQTAYLGQAAFFAKINPALSGSASLLYATYLGGSSLGDQASGIALDSAGNAYVTGKTSSTNFPTTSGAFQATYGGGEWDAFVAKFNPTLSGPASLVYSTYLGGSGYDGYVASSTAEAQGIAVDSIVPQTDGGIAVDSEGNAYVTSSTTSTNFPTTPGAFQVSSNLSGKSPFPSDAFVTKLNATGTALVYSTYLGGGTNTYSGGAGIAVDSSGDADVTGWTNSTAFPTNNPLQASNQGGYDAFVTTLNPSGSGLLFSTYLGGSSNDDGMGIALDSAGNAYVAGVTSSSNFPTTAGAYQTTAGSGFVLKITSVVGPSFAITGPASLTAGTSGTFTITALNANGTPNTGYAGTVQISSSDPKAVLPGNLTISGGSVTFSVTLKTAGTQSVSAADVNNPSMAGSDTALTISPAAAANFVLSGPSSIAAGTAFSLTVTALDAYGNIATGYTGTVHFTDSVSGATLPSNYSFKAADNGVHTFTGLKLKTKGTQTLTVTDTLLGTIVGNLTINVN